LFSTHKKTNRHNFTASINTGLKPVISIALHNNSTAARARLEYAGNLLPELFLTIGSNV